MQSLYACLMTEPFYGRFSNKMTGNVRVLGVPPPKSRFWGPLFLQNPKSAPINCRYSGPFFAKTRVPPRGMEKMAQKRPFLTPFFAPDQAKFWLDRACFCPKMGKKCQNRRFWGPNWPLLGVSGPRITDPFFALFNGKMGHFLAFFRFLTPIFSN